MEKTVLKNGMVKLTSANGVVDKRNGQWYQEAIVKENKVKYFADATSE